MIGIYKIINPKGKIYIGQTLNFNKRITHYKNLTCKKQRKLYYSLLKYSFDNHIVEFIEYCNIEDLNERERYYQDLYNVLEEGLNCRLQKQFDKSGKLSIETRNRISNSQIGKKLSKETKNKISLGNLNKIVSEETKIKMKLNSTKSKKVICTITGKIWNSITDCANELKYNSKTLNNKLTGFRKNNTTLIYFEDE